MIFLALEIRIDQQSINKTARDPNYVDTLEFIQVKMHIISLLILIAGVFTKPGTALMTDQESCASKSPWTEPVKKFETQKLIIFSLQ